MGTGSAPPRWVVASGPAGESAQRSGASSSRAARNVPPGPGQAAKGRGLTYGRVRVMSLSCFYNPHHGSLIHATGHAEVWTDWNSTSKFSQYGWRCTTNEDAYSNKTLMGNWNQERYDIRKVAQPKPLPSQYAHYFESVYSSDYNKERHHGSRRFKREPHWFPGHQPELEPPPFKPTARSCYMIDYGPPQGRTPLICEMLGKEQEGTQQKQ